MEALEESGAEGICNIHSLFWSSESSSKENHHLNENQLKDEPTEKQKMIMFSINATLFCIEIGILLFWNAC